MKIREHVLLSPLTTFRVGGPARYFAEVENTEELKEAVSFARGKALPFFILGKGSNILISDEGFPGLVIKIEFLGISADEPGDEILLTAKAGESWDDLVARTVADGWRGMENLSGIPGSVGAAPVQNIGAYGAEVKDFIERVAVYDTVSGEEKEFSNEECRFRYRDSIFKEEIGKGFVVTSVTFRLSRSLPLKFSYHGVSEYFAGKKIKEKDVSPALLREAILSIRAGKLPRVTEYGTAGSFFKNPELSDSRVSELLRHFPKMPVFEHIPGVKKVSAAYLIDKICGLKGYVYGHARVYEKHGLILIADEGASAEEIFSLANKILLCVREKTGITLVPEVEYVGEFK